MIKELLHRWKSLLRIIKIFRPDFVTEIGGAFISFPSKICNIPSIVFTDSEHVFIDRYITYPFSLIILTPKCFKKKLGKNHQKYNGFHEIAYLHPNYFQPDSKIFSMLKIDKNEPFFILRFVSWEASHDIFHKRLSTSFKNILIKELRKRGKVFISSEKPLPSNLSKYELKIPPYMIHDALYYADLYLGDSATMATESGLLGTPSIYTSSLVGNMGNFFELMDEYQLVYAYKSPEESLKKALMILDNVGYNKKVWAEKRKRIFKEKINVTEFMINIFENYPNIKIN
jgi:predicted glycosyltransferase